MVMAKKIAHTGRPAKRPAQVLPGGSTRARTEKHEIKTNRRQEKSTWASSNQQGKSCEQTEEKSIPALLSTQPLWWLAGHVALAGR